MAFRSTGIEEIIKDISVEREEGPELSPRAQPHTDSCNQRERTPGNVWSHRSQERTLLRCVWPALEVGLGRLVKMKAEDALGWHNE